MGWIFRAVFFYFFSLKFLSGQVAERGVFKVNQEGIVFPLKGEWEIFPQKLVLPFEKIETVAYIEVPGSWQLKNRDIFPKPVGFGTYRLKIIFPKSAIGKIYALKLGHISSAYKLYLQDDLAYEMGKVGTSKEETIPAWKHDILVFSVSREEMVLTIQVANFSDGRFGGILQNLELGEVNLIQKAVNRKFFYHTSLATTLLILGIYHLVLFAFRKTDKHLLAFGLFALDIGIRTTLFGGHILQKLGEIPYYLLLYMDYVTIYTAPALLSLYMHFLFPKEIKKKFLYIVFSITGIFLLSLIILPSPEASLTRPVFHLLVILLIAFYILLLTQAILRKRSMAIPFSLGFLLLAAFAIYDIYQNRVGKANYQLPLGLTLFMFIQTYIVAKINTRFYNEALDISKKLQQINESIHRFVPKDALRLLNKTDITDITPGNQVQLNLTVMFADMRNFSQLSELMSPQENFNFLNSYLSQLSPIIRENGGFIDKYLGDGFMALFPSSPSLAFKAANDLQKVIHQYNEKRKRANYLPIHFGIGIHYGTVMLGVLGEAERLNVTVISDDVNLTSRIQELSRVFESPVLMSEVFFQQLTNVFDMDYRMLGQVRVKGKSKAVTIFEVLSARPEEEKEALALSKGIFERGIFHYLQKEYSRAEELFEKSLVIFPQDKVAMLYRDRCRQLKENPEASWNLGFLLV